MSTVLDQFSLTGRRALITGGHTGLGFVMAQALAQAGADVILASRTRDACRQAADRIAASTRRACGAYEVDVTSLASVEALADAVEKDAGPVDILINNAGINRRGPIQQLSEADWDAVIDTNLKGVFLCCRAFGPRMVARGWGRVINLSSILGSVALPERATYSSSKGGVSNLTRVLGLEWATTGVTVNALCPGPFATEMNRTLLDDPVKYAAFVAKIPMGRWGELHEITGPVVFLASNASSYVTGSLIYVDGGWTAQ